MENVCYLRRKKIGEGTYAVIYMADKMEKNDKSEGKIINNGKGKRVLGQVAIKRMKKWDKGIDISTIREIKTLSRINDQYICNIQDIFFFGETLNIILEYAEGNLEDLIKNREIIFMPADIKWMFYMICRGVCALHSKFILHRDLKPSNILIKDGILKLADFGLSRDIGDDMTSNVVTRWYRAPELIYGDRNYAFSVDIWALGCILGEMLLRVPIFPAEDDFKQLEMIFKTLGTPDSKDCSYFKQLPNYLEYPNYPKIMLKNIFSGASDDIIDLIGKMFIYNPIERIDIYEILQHEYFTNEPLPNRDTNITKISKG
ncbi:putative serine/threonine-protein kinase KIN28 like protein [Dictyocoela muelleri]|nr:putative serine/threonine-protein kinase KIN28 like protein [Dictyocoela muelleri]